MKRRDFSINRYGLMVAGAAVAWVVMRSSFASYGASKYDMVAVMGGPESMFDLGIQELGAGALLAKARRCSSNLI